MNKMHRDGVDIGVAFSSAAKRQFYKDPPPPGNANTSEQRAICLRGRIKAALRTIAKFAYSLMRPFLSRIGFRIRRYFTEGLRQEILQEFQRVSAGTLQEVKELIPASINAGIEDRFLKESAISRRQDAVYISNGLIDADSYLHLSMQNEVGGWSEFKTRYGDDGWYFLYEKIFRGSEEEITKRQNKYVVYLQNCYSTLKNRNEQGYFLDFGSGRGEFLSLLTKKNIPARGVDANHLHIEHAAKKGVDAICIDGISYLKKVKNNALFGITMFQVAEHLEFQMLKNFVNISFRKIMPGGIILIETTNPSCVRAMQHFYLDPSHVRPYPPELLKFHLEWEGFIEVKVIFYMPVFEIRPAEDCTNYVGYALVGYKPIDAESK